MAGISSIATVLELAVIDKVLRGETPLSTKSRSEQNFAALSGFLACIGLGFLIYAAHLWLLPRYTPETAAALTAALAFFLAFVVMVGAYTCMALKRSHLSKFRQNITKNIESALEMLDDDLGNTIRENPKTALAAAWITGFVIGDRIT